MANCRKLCEMSAIYVKDIEGRNYISIALSICFIELISVESDTL